MKYITKLALIALAMAGFNIQAGELSSEVQPEQEESAGLGLGAKLGLGALATGAVGASGYAANEFLKLRAAQNLVDTTKEALDKIARGEASKLGYLSAKNAYFAALDNLNEIKQSSFQMPSMPNISMPSVPERISNLWSSAPTTESGPYIFDEFSGFARKAEPSSWYSNINLGNPYVKYGLGALGALGAGAGLYYGGRSLYNRYMNQPMGITPMGQDATAIRALAQQHMSLSEDQLKQDRAMQALLFIKNINMNNAAETNGLSKAFFEDLLSDINSMTGLEKVADAVRTVIQRYGKEATYRNIHRKGNVNNAINSLKSAINEYLQ